jgi:L-threonylcarbamoyladenylate synthase|tara:strand:+ start:24 stop:977 length:954 start_codon:yes stop_codon:yes gene_type:complete
MKNIYSNIAKVNNSNTSKAIKYLKKNQVIGVPTETVYGLAGNAYSNIAVKKIYSLKKRPKINPLIIHYYNVKSLAKDAILNKNFLKLYKNFCPGPLTFVLKKKKSSKVSRHATAKLDTIAVRFPKNNIIRNILKKIKFPLAIPSANKSTGVSPVQASHVAEEFGRTIKMILNGGNCKIGIESTVVDLSKKIRILRPGFVGISKISKVINFKVLSKNNSSKIKAPGALKKHYSPGIPMKLNQKRGFKNYAFIVFGKDYIKSKNTFNLSKKSNLQEAARNLYKIFRKIKNSKYKKIYVAKIPNKGIGVAINDRLKHAAN